MDCEHVPSLRELCLPVCLARITSSLSVTNVWNVRRFLMFPWYTNNSSIRFVLDAFISDHFIEISQTDLVLSLDEQEMRWLMDNQDIRASEATMLYCLLRWHQHQPAEREKALKEMFSKIQLSMIPSEYLWSVIDKYGLIKVMPELVSYKVQQEEEGLPDPSNTLFEQNLCNIALMEFIMLQTSNPDNQNEALHYSYLLKCNLPFSHSHNELTKFLITELPSSQSESLNDSLECLHFVFREKLFIFQFFTEFPSFGLKNPKGYCMSLDNKEFYSCTPSPTYIKLSTDYLTCGMYVFFLACTKTFDVPSSREYRDVIRYDPVNDQWKTMARMIHGHHSLDVVPVTYDDRYIFVFDGQNCEKYDIYTDKWSALQPAPAGLKYSGGHQIENKIFLFDLESIPRRVTTYDPLSDTWSEHDELDYLDHAMPGNDRHLITMCFLGKILVFSGGRYFPHSISEIRLKKKKVTSLCKLSFIWPYLNDDDSDINLVMLSRGARVFIEHNKTIKYTTTLQIASNTDVVIYN